MSCDNSQDKPSRRICYDSEVLLTTTFHTLTVKERFKIFQWRLGRNELVSLRFPLELDHGLLHRVIFANLLRL